MDDPISLHEGAAQRALTRLVVTLEARQPIPEDLTRWLLTSIGRYRRGAGALDWCLGLRMSSAEAVRRRNEALRAAADCVASAPRSEWGRAGRLAEAIKNYKAERADCPCGHLTRAFEFGIVPKTQRHLYEIIRRY